MNPIRRFVSLAITGATVLIALCAIWYVWTYYERDPRTRNGHVRADVVGVTTDVSGLVTAVDVVSEQRVKKGDLLFQVDTERFEIAVQQAQANLESAQAALVYAGQQATRNRNLHDLVAKQELDQSESTLRTARATVDQARAALAAAQLNLARSSVRAPVNGIVSYVDLKPGAYATAGKGLLALVDLDSLRVEGYFQETRLDQIHVGDRAEVRLLGSDAPLYGHVASITSAINDSDTNIGSNLLPSIAPNFAWVRLAQRIPVRIKIDPGSELGVLIPGRSASVTILSEYAGRDSGGAGHITAAPATGTRK
ncbi:RND transporter [Burkholderia cepacia]|uniref:HlyD family secretion protein n=1 Tax=Burkholderia cenocepacia TaxID=95486 RepID=A0ABD4UIG9_9BURK|nr:MULTISPECIES: HlyD family secretion protein [Burkholderia cepacia complex]KVV23139.1 RND transporter [Burkholderia cepacia]MCW3698183.1 HlyD family secretion protein [Burkholderia cenocepacia]MCW3706036.1 HlyD family secretion protein [Burkholderia cenocepacia]MCW3714277.1 HlyD family secretion protein [Burkholderia cenocepacia]MCW3722343.1 HlyD family secretion protein [Burkholderia cenocepacia]